MVTYRAPEFTLHSKATSACDQYSLAIIVYEWLCGDVPFQGEWERIFYQHMQITPPSLREKNPAIPHEVEEVVMKALAKDPEQRYESIQEFAEALEEAILPPKADRFVLPDRSGEQFGKYILVRRLGQGGFAEVYLGEHITLKKNFVAIKILYAHLSVQQLEGLTLKHRSSRACNIPQLCALLISILKETSAFWLWIMLPKERCASSTREVRAYHCQQS